MARERFLFRADLEGYTYREILELRPGSARLLVPSSQALRVAWIVTTAIALSYVLVATSIFALTLRVSGGAQGVPGLLGLIAVAGLIAYFAGLVATELWWDRQNLPLLAEDSRAAFALQPLGTRSFGTFLELHAVAGGEDLRIAVHGPPSKVENAVRWTGLLTTPPGT